MSCFVEIDRHRFPESILGNEVNRVESSPVGKLLDVAQLSGLPEDEKDVTVEAGIGRRRRRVEADLGLAGRDVVALDVDDQPVKPGSLDRVLSAGSIGVDHEEGVQVVGSSVRVGNFRLVFDLRNMSKLNNIKHSKLVNHLEP